VFTLLQDHLLEENGSKGDVDFWHYLTNVKIKQKIKGNYVFFKCEVGSKSIQAFWERQ
jgi:hypothetical protein